MSNAQEDHAAFPRFKHTTVATPDDSPAHAVPLHWAALPFAGDTAHRAIAGMHRFLYCTNDHRPPVSIYSKNGALIVHKQRQELQQAVGKHRRSLPFTIQVDDGVLQLFGIGP